MRIFIDSTAWVNLGDPGQAYHQAAQKFLMSALENDYQFYTSNISLGNALSILKSNVGADQAFHFYDIVEEAYLGAHLSILWVGRRTQKEAIRLMRRYPELTLDLNDFANIVLMTRRRIPLIFSFKKEYEDLGLKVVPEVEEQR